MLYNIYDIFDVFLYNICAYQKCSLYLQCLQMMVVPISQGKRLICSILGWAIFMPTLYR